MSNPSPIDFTKPIELVHPNTKISTPARYLGRAAYLDKSLVSVAIGKPGAEKIVVVDEHGLGEPPFFNHIRISNVVEKRYVYINVYFKQGRYSFRKFYTPGTAEINHSPDFIYTYEVEVNFGVCRIVSELNILKCHDIDWEAPIQTLNDVPARLLGKTENVNGDTYAVATGTRGLDEQIVIVDKFGDTLVKKSRIIRNVISGNLLWINVYEYKVPGEDFIYVHNSEENAKLGREHRGMPDDYKHTIKLDLATGKCELTKV